MPTYKLKDEFSQGQSSPVPDPLSASGSGAVGSWDVTDPSSIVSVVRGSLLTSGEDAAELWTTNNLLSSELGAIFATFRPDGFQTSSGFWLHSTQSPASPDTTVRGITFRNASIRIAPMNTNIDIMTGSHTRSIDFYPVYIRRVGGGYWLLLSGGLYGDLPTARLVGVVPGGGDDDPFFGLVQGGNGRYYVDHVRAIDVADLPAEWNTRFGIASDADEFSGSEALSGRTLEIGGLTWGLADNSAAGTVDNGVVTNTGNFYGIINRSDNQQITEATFTAGSTTGNAAEMLFGLLFRGVGTAQSDFIRFFWNGDLTRWIDGKN